MVKPVIQSSSKKQQALLAYQQQNLPEARRLLEKLLKQDRHDAECWQLLGITYGRLGKYAKAEQAFRQVLALAPHSTGAYNNLGLALEAQAKIETAFEAFQQALRLNPKNTDTHYNLANSLVTLGRLDEAVTHYEEVLQEQPQNYAALNNLGDVLQRLARYSEAAQIFKRIIAVYPESAEAHYNLGNVYKSINQHDAAQQSYLQAVKLNPDFEAAWNNIANLYVLQGKRQEAATAYEKVLTLNPDNGPAYLFLASSLLRHGKWDAAMSIYAKARQHKKLQDIDPGAIHSSYLFALNYSAKLSNAEIYQAHLEHERQYMTSLLNTSKSYRNDCQNSRRLRVGYVSPDLYQHSVAYYLEPILARHDTTAMEIFCYADVRKPDETTARLRGYAQTWRDISEKSDHEVAELILNDQIDILVDLAGHTADNRLLVFAQKPAPVQITYLGYPNTTGLSTIAYRLTDAWADPQELEQYYSETLLRLPKGFLCYRPPIASPDVAVLPLKENGSITFGSFNNLSKMMPEVIALWSRLLKEIPGSRLMIKNEALRENAVREEQLGRFAEHGISAEQIELIGWLANKDDHLKLYGQIDIALDTFPYNGTTTTCEALWMGVPVITLCGDRHAARVGNSLLHQVGLEELIAHSENDYVEIAKRLASDAPRLQALRQGMRQRILGSPLYDETGFTRQLEQVYQQLWQVWCKQNSKEPS